MAGDIDIGGVKATVEIEDKGTPTLELLERQLEHLDETMGGLGKSFIEQTASFFTAEAALEAVKEAAHLAAETLAELTVEGAKIAQVEANFEHLTETAGILGSTLTGALREGTHGVITDFELMKTANENMLAGVKLTAAQYKDLGETAFAIAQAKGIETAQALDMLNNAVLRGNDRMLKRIGIHADLDQAEIKFAQSLNTTTDKLTQDQVLEARRQAVLEAMGKVTDRLGEQTEGLGTKLDQAKVVWNNFTEELGKTVAKSPVIAAAFDGIKASLTDAFGGTSEALVKRIAGVIDDVLIAVMNFAEGTVDAIGVIGMEWNAAIVVFESVKAGWAGIAYVAEGALLLIEKAINAVSFGALDDEVAGLEGDMERWYGVMAESQQSIIKHQEAEQSWAVTTGNVREKIEALRQKMVDAKTANDGLAHAHADAGTAAEAHAGAEVKVGEAAKLTKEEYNKLITSWRELNNLSKSYEATLESVNPEIRASVEYYAGLGAKVEELVGAFPGLTKVQAEAAIQAAKSGQEIQKIYTDVFAITAKMHGDNVNDYLALETRRYQEHIRQLELEGKATTAMLDAEAAKFKATVEAEIHSRAEQNDQTKDYYEKQYDDAKNAYDLLMELGSNATEESKRRAYDEMVERERDLNNWENVARDKFAAVGQHAKQAGDQGAQAFTTMGEAIRAMAAGLDATSIKIKTLSGEIITLKEAKDRLDAGGSYAVTSQNFMTEIQRVATTNGWNPSAQGSNIDYQQALAWARRGYSFQEILTMFANAKQGSNGPLPPPQGPRIPGFEVGGVGDFGSGTIAMLHGREAIIPLGANGGVGGTVVNNHFYVNGTGQQVARTVADELMNQLKRVRQFGAS